MDYTAHFRPNATPQDELLPGQVLNNAGGGAYQIGPFERLKRFLVLGTEGGTYYQSEREITRENAKTILECVREDAYRTADVVIEMWNAGRIHRADPVMFALALVFSEGTPQAKAFIHERFAATVRTGYHLFRFVHYVTQFRGWGRSLKRLVASWYDRDLEKLAYQLVKYKQREGWSHRDILRLVKVKPRDDSISNLLGYAVGKIEEFECDQTILHAAAIANDPTLKPKAIADVIRRRGLTHEMVAPEHKQHADVWEALSDHMPLGALIRNLGNLGSKQIIAPGKFDKNRELASRITDAAAIHKARVHPMAVLSAARVYQSGRGLKGSLSWDPAPEVVDALDEAFYLAFDNVEPTGKRYLLGIDVSASMGCSVNGMTGISCREAAAAMALVTIRTEPFCAPMAFTADAPRAFTADQHWGYDWRHDTKFKPLPLTKRTTLSEAISLTSGHLFGGTDCALPMRYALENDLDIDVFVIYTDNETWHGKQHPIEALREYRRKKNAEAKLCVVAFTATKFSIADPSDPGTLDVVGFDTATPQVMSEFARGFSS